MLGCCIWASTAMPYSVLARMLRRCWGTGEWFTTLQPYEYVIVENRSCRALFVTHLRSCPWQIHSLHVFPHGLAGLKTFMLLDYRTFAAIYILSGLGGSIASFLFSDLVSVGASGAIFGLLGASAGLIQCCSLLLLLPSTLRYCGGGVPALDRVLNPSVAMFCRLLLAQQVAAGVHSAAIQSGTHCGPELFPGFKPRLHDRQQVQIHATL